MLLSVSAQKNTKEPQEGTGDGTAQGGNDEEGDQPPQPPESSSEPEPKPTNSPVKEPEPSKAPTTSNNIPVTTAQPVASTSMQVVTSTKKIVQQTTVQQVVPSVTSATAPQPTQVDPNENGTPVPEINEKAENAVQKGSGDGLSWKKVGIIAGIGIGALFVIGIVFNFINKKKSSGDNMDINFVVDNNQAPEPEMSTSMFNQQNDMYGQQNQGYQDYDMQYGQYNQTDPYNQADPYNQGYAQDVNFAQRTLSLNRNPSANAQNYQVDENAREVIYNHRPEAGDEIELRRGDQATIYEKYEDGWAWGYNITTGKTGMFPQQCLA
jgi:hypothetical protein